MIPKLLCIALSSALLLASPPAAADEAPPLVRGGAVQAAPLANGDLIHVPVGRTVVTLDYADPQAPRRTSVSAPAEGVINSLVRRGDHLYAGWRGLDNSGGVTAWSLADPRHPELVGESAPYTDGEYAYALGVVLADDRLFLFDNTYGIFLADLADPARPAFSHVAAGQAATQYTHLVAHGSTIHASGRGWTSGVALDLYDVSIPEAPLLQSRHTVDGVDSFSLILEPTRAIGVGNRLSLFDLADPSQLVPRGFVDIPPAMTGARAGDHVYTFGFGAFNGGNAGIDIWNIADADAPAAVGHLDARALGARHALVHADRLVFASETDLVHTFDVAVPQSPALSSTHLLAGGVSARDIAVHDDGRLVLLQANYGLSLNDPDTLDQTARLDVDLPETLEERAFGQIALDGDTAYLVAWGYGLVVADLSDPARPREIGRAPFPFASAIDVHGDHAYVAKRTNGSLLGAFDVSDPTAPVLLWQAGLEAPANRLRIAGRHLYVAQSAQPGQPATGGLRVYDLADPAAPVTIGHVDDGCGTATDLVVDHEVSLVYLACREGMQVVDVLEPAQPSVVGRYDADAGSHSQFNQVAQRGDRAWYANLDGLHELDVSDPLVPALRRLTPTGRHESERVEALADGRVIVLGGDSGVHLFGADDGGEDAIALDNRVPVTGLAGQAGDDLLFSIQVPEGVAALTVLSHGGSGNVALLGRHGRAPTPGDADARSDRPGNNETIRIVAPAPGTYYVRLVGNTAYSGVTLQARY